MWLTENREKNSRLSTTLKLTNSYDPPQVPAEASPPPHLRRAGAKGPPCRQSPPANYSFIPAGLGALVRLALDVLTKILIWQRAAAAAVVVEAFDWEVCSGRVPNVDGFADEWRSDSGTTIWCELK